MYFRSLDTHGGVYNFLVIAKTRVAPIKKVTFPRLELCEDHLLSLIMKHLQEILAIPTCNLPAFTDSTIVLYWIYGRSQRFKPFEANRIGEFKKMFPLKNWLMSSAKKTQLMLDLVAFHQEKSFTTISGKMVPLYASLDSNDDDGIAPITPGHFLTGKPLGARPDQVSTAPISTLK